jgi:GTP cyclohydrolase II
MAWRPCHATRERTERGETAKLPIKVSPNPHNTRYLKTKREKMGHLL